MKRLSFIVPLYNSSKWMKKCVDSLLCQDIPLDEYEIILVDDGGPDASGSIADAYAEKYANIVVIHQENKGTSGARNAGLYKASGKYVWFVDPDDYIESKCAASLLEQMESENLDVLRFNYCLVDEQYHTVEKNPSELMNDYSSGILRGDVFLRQRLGVACFIWTFVFKLSLIKENNIYFYEGDYFDDTPWTPRILQAARRVNSCDVICYYYLQRSDSLVRAVSPDARNKKIAGQRFLIEELSKQKKEATKNAKKWYSRTLSFCAVCLLGLVSHHCTADIASTIRFLKQYNLRFLTLKKATLKFKIKALIYNVSPRLLVFLFRNK